MEFKINREQFLNCILKAQGVVEKTSNMPILSTVLISSEQDRVTISATDLELSFQQTLTADVISEGNAAVPGRKLFEILRESKGQEFYIKKEENERIFISDGNAKFRLTYLPADEFPLLTEPEDISYTSISGTDIREMIKKTIYTVTSENIGFKLSGIFVEKKEKEADTFLRFVATDGHRLSLIDRKVSGIENLNLEGGILIPRKGMVEISKLAQDESPMQVGLKDKNFITKQADTILIIRLLDVKFPNYEDVIPDKTSYILRLDKTRFIEALRRMLIFSTEKYRAVKMVIKENGMDLISTNMEIGEAFEEIEIEHRGNKIEENMEIAFNPKFFMDALLSMDSNAVDLGLINQNKPCVITGEDDPDFLALIMPMRL